MNPFTYKGALDPFADDNDLSSSDSSGGVEEIDAVVRVSGGKGGGGRGRAESLLPLKRKGSSLSTSQDVKRAKSGSSSPTHSSGSQGKDSRLGRRGKRSGDVTNSGRGGGGGGGGSGGDRGEITSSTEDEAGGKDDRDKSEDETEDDPETAALVRKYMKATPLISTSFRALSASFSKSLSSLSELDDEPPTHLSTVTSTTSTVGSTAGAAPELTSTTPAGTAPASTLSASTEGDGAVSVLESAGGKGKKAKGASPPSLHVPSQPSPPSTADVFAGFSQSRGDGPVAASDSHPPVFSLPHRPLPSLVPLPATDHQGIINLSSGSHSPDATSFSRASSTITSPLARVTAAPPHSSSASSSRRTNTLRNTGDGHGGEDGDDDDDLGRPHHSDSCVDGDAVLADLPPLPVLRRFPSEEETRREIDDLVLKVHEGRGLAVDTKSLKLQIRFGGLRNKFKVLKSDPVSKILEAFCLKNNLSLKGKKVVFDGEVLAPFKTFGDYDLEDDFLLDVEE